MMLNEINEVQRATLPPTDSRLRPDIRAMEDGDIGKEADCCASATLEQWKILVTAGVPLVLIFLNFLFFLICPDI